MKYGHGPITPNKFADDCVSVVVGNVNSQPNLDSPSLPPPVMTKATIHIFMRETQYSAKETATQYTRHITRGSSSNVKYIPLPISRDPAEDGGTWFSVGGACHD